jgi:hypothetical protein
MAAKLDGKPPPQEAIVAASLEHLDQVVHAYILKETRRTVSCPPADISPFVPQNGKPNSRSARRDFDG